MSRPHYEHVVVLDKSGKAAYNESGEVSETTIAAIRRTV